MAQVDPNIILGAVQQQRAGTSPFSKLSEIIQFQGLLDQQKQRAAAAQKQQTLSDLAGRHTIRTDEGIKLDQGPFLHELSQIDPQLALEHQNKIQQQALESQVMAAKQKKAEADEKIALQKASKAELEKAGDIQDMIASSVGAVLGAKPENQQAVLDDQLDRLIDNGVITQEMLQSGAVPLQVTPETLPILKGIHRASLSSKDQIEAAIQKKATPAKETAAEKSKRERAEKQQDFRAQIDSRFVSKMKKGRNLNDKTVATIQRFQTSAPTILAQVNDLQGLISKSSLTELKNPASNASANIASTLGSLQFNVKELFDLGALQAPDLQLIDRLTGDPSRFNASNLRKESTAKRLKSMSKNIVRLFNNKMGSLGISKFSPDEILALGADGGVQGGAVQGGGIPTFATIEEAEASGYKGPAIVGGVEGDLD